MRVGGRASPSPSYSVYFLVDLMLCSCNNCNIALCITGQEVFLFCYQRGGDNFIYPNKEHTDFIHCSCGNIYSGCYFREEIKSSTHG